MLAAGVSLECVNSNMTNKIRQEKKQSENGSKRISYKSLRTKKSNPANFLHIYLENLPLVFSGFCVKMHVKPQNYNA